MTDDELYSGENMAIPCRLVAAATRREREEIVAELDDARVLPTVREDLRVFKAGIQFACEKIKARGEKKMRWTCSLCGAPVDSEIVAARKLREKFDDRFVGLRERYEKPGKVIANISQEEWSDGRERLWRTINELIAAVNEMRGKA